MVSFLHTSEGPNKYQTLGCLLKKFSVQSSKRQLSPERENSEVKRPRVEEEALDGGINDEERLVEERLKHLQEFAEKSATALSKDDQPSSSSSSARECVKSSWQQIGNLLVYTAAGVKASNKVRKTVNQGVQTHFH